MRGGRLNLISKAQKSAKDRLKSFLMDAGVVPLATWLVGARVVILRYHSIQNDPEHYANSIGAGIIHVTSAFAAQMELVAQQYDPVTLDDVLAFAEGKVNLSPRSVAVTFDDGYADNYELAEPILRRFGIRASFYVAVDSIAARRPIWFCRLNHAFAMTRRQTWPDSTENCFHELGSRAAKRSAFLVASRRCALLAGGAQEAAVRRIEEELDVEPLSSEECPMLSWDQVRRLHRVGHIVGSHTLTHPNLAYVGDETLQKELTESKRKLEEELGIPVVHFSYPSPILEPHYTERTMSSINESGYRTAVTCTQGPVRIGHSPLALRRVSAAPARDEFLWNLDNTLLGRRV